jgi:phage-related protein
LKAFPSDVRDVMGYALFLAQTGSKHGAAKSFKGVGSGVLQVADNYSGDTYRTIYTVRFAEVVYMLHAFQKKARKGIATPKKEVDLIKQRLKDAEKDYERRKKKG